MDGREARPLLADGGLRCASANAIQNRFHTASWRLETCPMQKSPSETDLGDPTRRPLARVALTCQPVCTCSETAEYLGNPPVRSEQSIRVYASAVPRKLTMNGGSAHWGAVGPFAVYSWGCSTADSLLPRAVAKENLLRCHYYTRFVLGSVDAPVPGVYKAAPSPSPSARPLVASRPVSPESRMWLLWVSTGAVPGCTALPGLHGYTGGLHPVGALLRAVWLNPPDPPDLQSLEPRVFSQG